MYDPRIVKPRINYQYSGASGRLNTPHPIFTRRRKQILNQQTENQTQIKKIATLQR